MKESRHQLNVHISLTSHTERSSSSTYYTYLYACTLFCATFFFFFFKLRLDPLICTLSSELERTQNDAQLCYKLLIYLQPLQKRKKGRNHLVWSHRTQWKTLQAFTVLSQSVASRADQCDQCDAVIEANKTRLFFSQFHYLNLADFQLWKENETWWSHFICHLLHRSQR